MFVKRIDRYVSWRFLTFLFGSLCLLGFLYASFDLLKKVEDIQQAAVGQKLALLAAYYGYMLPLFLVDIIPAMILVAAGMVLVQMARAHELLVLKASGVSLYRVTAPVFACTAIISVLSFAFQQSIGPRFARQKEMLDRKIEDKVETELLLQDPTDRNLRLLVGQYDYVSQAMQDVLVMQFNPENEARLRRILMADSARLSPGGELHLETVNVLTFDATGTSQASGNLLPSMTIQTGLAPFDFVQASRDADQQMVVVQTLAQLREQIRRNPNIPDFRVVYYSRLASIFNPIILLLVGIPCLVGFEQTVRSRFLAAIISIVVAAGFYALSFVFGSMGATQTVPPVIAGWLPTIIGGSAGLWLFEGMHT